jgi:hypothetical protein
MKEHWIILKFEYIFSCGWNFASLLLVKYDSSFGSSFCLPFGKADHTPSPALARLWRVVKGSAQPYNSLTLDTLDLGHPRLSLN